MSDEKNILQELEKIYQAGYTQEAAVEYLTRNGFHMDQIKDVFFTVYPFFEKKSILKSPSFVFSFVVLVLLSLSPCIGYFFHSDGNYIFFTIGFALLTYGYLRLIKACIIFWIVLLSSFIIYLLIVILGRMSGMRTNDLYSYSNMISVILFSFGLLICLSNVYKWNERYKEQYKFS